MTRQHLTRLVNSTLLAFCLWLVWVGPLQANSPDITLEIVPQEIAWRGDRPLTLTAVLHNNSATTVRRPQLIWETALPLSLTPTVTPTQETIAPDEEIFWQFSVQPAATATLFEAGQIDFRLTYEQKVGEAWLQRVVLSAVSVAPAQPQPGAQVATVELQSAATRLDENRSETVYVVVTNRLNRPLTVTALDVYHPSYIETSWPITWANGANVLAPQTQLHIPVQLSGTQAAQPGDAIFLFETEVTWEEHGKTETAAFTIPLTLAIGVFGETALLGLLGIPLLLLLPGFLFLTMLRFLVSKTKTFDPDPLTQQTLAWWDSFLPTGTTAEFWGISVPLSLLFTTIYQSITTQRNFYQLYGFSDIMWLWISSVIAAISLWLGIFIYIIQAKSEREEHVPAESDDPLTLLKKLKKQGLSLVLERVTVKQNDGGNYLAFIVQKYETQDEFVWVVPTIGVKNSGALSAENYDKLEDELDKGDQESLESIINMANLLDLYWHDDNNHIPSGKNRPHLVAKAMCDENGKEVLISPNGS